MMCWQRGHLLLSACGTLHAGGRLQSLNDPSFFFSPIGKRRVLTCKSFQVSLQSPVSNPSIHRQASKQGSPVLSGNYHSAYGISRMFSFPPSLSQVWAIPTSDLVKKEERL